MTDGKRVANTERNIHFVESNFSYIESVAVIRCAQLQTQLQLLQLTKRRNKQAMSKKRCLKRCRYVV